MKLKTALAVFTELEKRRYTLDADPGEDPGPSIPHYAVRLDAGVSRDLDERTLRIRVTPAGGGWITNTDLLRVVLDAADLANVDVYIENNGLELH